MKTLLFSLMFVLAACGKPELSGIPSLVLPDGSIPEEDTPATPTIIPFWESVRLFMDATGATMTNAVAIGAEIPNNNSRMYLDLTDFTQVRAQFISSLTSSVVACRIEYSLNDGGVWNTLVPNFSAGTLANVANKSAFVTIPDAARTDVLVRALIAGDGALDPIVRYIGLDLKGTTTVEH